MSAPVTKTARRASLANSDGPLSWYQVKAVAPLSAPYCSVVCCSDSRSPSVAGQPCSASPRNPTVRGPICSSVNQQRPRVYSCPMAGSLGGGTGPASTGSLPVHSSQA